MAGPALMHKASWLPRVTKPALQVRQKRGMWWVMMVMQVETLAGGE